jgi:hypothetical protein
VKTIEPKKYKIRVVRGAFVDPDLLDELGAKTIEKLEHGGWESIDEVVVDLGRIKELQKNMTRHYDDTVVPWYMDGYDAKDRNKLVVAFGADDGEGGKIFKFLRNDKREIGEVVKYGISKGIPKEQMDFADIDF